MQIAKRGEFFKAEGKLVYGWALVCEELVDGAWTPYVDTQGDHIPEDAMVEAAIEFAKHSRVGKDMHAGDAVGSVPLVYVITRGADALGITSTKTGMLIGWEPSDPELLKAVAAGERTGFSIGGEILESDRELAKFAKAAEGEASVRPRVFRRFRIDEISLVDRPAMEGAMIAYVKRDARNSTPATPASKVSTMTTAEYEAKIAELEAKLAEKTVEPAPADKAEGDVPAQPTVEQLLARIAELEAAEAAREAQAVELAAKPAEVAKADPIVHTCVDGTPVRKSDGALALKFAKQADEAMKVAKAEKDARELTELKKRAADTLGALAGADDAHVDVLRAVESITDTTKRDAAVATLKAANAAMVALSVAKGVGGSASPTGNAHEAFQTGLAAFAKSKGTTPVSATREFIHTPEGSALYAATQAIGQ